MSSARISSIIREKNARSRFTDLTRSNISIFRFLKATDNKDIEAVMGTVGSDIPSHAMWHYVNNVGTYYEVKSGESPEGHN